MKVKNVNLHVPLKPELYDKLKIRAHHMGFDSPQAYIRFWATAETSAVNTNGLGGYADLSSSQAMALRYFELLIAQSTSDLSMYGYIQQVALRLRRLDREKFLDNIIKTD